MSGRYVVLAKADEDLDDIAYYLIEQEDLELGLRFLAAADETFALLATQPEMGWKPKLEHPALASVRVFRIRGFEKAYILSARTRTYPDSSSASRIARSGDLFREGRVSLIDKNVV